MYILTFSYSDKIRQNSCVGYIERRGDFFGLKKKGPALRFFLFWAPFFFWRAQFLMCPFSPFFFLFGSPFFPEGLFFPFFLSNFLIWLLLCLLPALIFHQKESALRAPFFYFFWVSPFFVEGQFLPCPFFCLFFSCPSFDIAYLRQEPAIQIKKKLRRGEWDPNKI